MCTSRDEPDKLKGVGTSTPSVQPDHLQTPIAPAAPYVGAGSIGVPVRAVESFVAVLAVGVGEQRDLACSGDSGCEERKEEGERGVEHVGLADAVARRARAASALVGKLSNNRLVRTGSTSATCESKSRQHALQKSPPREPGQSTPARLLSSSYLAIPAPPFRSALNPVSTQARANSGFPLLGEAGLPGLGWGMCVCVCVPNGRPRRRNMHG